MTTFNLSKPRQTQYLWQMISSHWFHYDRPKKQRFLGSVRISQKATDQILDVVGYNLKDLSTVTYNKLHERFDEPEQNWLKIITFALSEYAYYYSSSEEKFWYGFCQKLKLPYNQNLEKTLRRIVSEGFDLLGLVQAKGGYPYVSTLWLQSGIPQQNLNHFAQLVQEFSNEYGWWEIAHTSYEDISEELFSFCQEKHPQWGTLINFLRTSCSYKEEEEVEPISGQLLQGIAVVAVELERQGTLPEDLKNDNDREQLLGNYYLPNNFFLRNWDSLIQVLTPEQRRLGSSRRIISRRQKPLSLVLDVADSFNMQLVLPEQSLWKKGWERLAGTFCQILEGAWEGTIPTNPGLMIPKQVVDIKTVAELWQWQLLDHRRNSLIEWKLEGVTSDLPCLIFDAWTGDRLNLDSANPTIRGTEEIICFTPRCVRLDFGDGIEIIDSCVPSSVRGWQGQQLALATKESLINLSSLDITPAQSISWKLAVDEQPSLRGLKLRGKNYIYLEIPTFWYPPVNKEITLNVSIENLILQQTIIATTKIVKPSDKWQAIPLDEWITEPGEYEARFWNQFHRWSYKFKIQANYQISVKQEINNLKTEPPLLGEIQEIPIFYNDPNTFWAEEMYLKNLLPLEIINLSLSDSQEIVFFQRQADSLGNLWLNLASFSDLLSPNSAWYALDYLRLGGETHRLIEMEIAPIVISWTWTNQAIHLSGLSSEECYSLSCWNLLLPEKPPIKINIPLISPDEFTITVPLELPPGIYHVQLFGARKLRCSLGWWCGSDQYTLPDEALEHEDLENYCYTMLGDESVQQFVNAAEKFDYDYQFIKTVSDSLQNLSCHFPEWLKINSLNQKLQSLLESLKIEPKSLALEKLSLPKIQQNNNVNLIATDIQRNWLLVTLAHPHKRKFVIDRIYKTLENCKLQAKILNLKIHKEKCLNNVLFLECSNPEVVVSYIKSLEYIQKIETMKQKDIQKILISLKNAN